MGAMKAKVVMAPVNWRLAGPEVAFIVGDCKAPVLFVGPEFIAQVRNIKAQLPGVRTVITTEGGAPEWQDFTAWRDAQAATIPDADQPEGHRDPALYVGHHGQAQGRDAVARQLPQPGADRQRGREARLEQVVDRRRLAGGDADLPYRRLRLGRDGLYHGARGVIAREFDPTKVLDFFEQSGITKLFMVPAAMQFVVRQPRARRWISRA